MGFEVRHTLEGRKFYVEKEDQIASLRYCLPEENVIELQFTYVPPILREQGIAKRIIQTALEYARDHKLKVIPSCRFVAYYIDKHEEYKKLLHTESFF
jgi:predicted GNAT family acetyltransferase